MKEIKYDLLLDILMDINNNPKITQTMLKKKYKLSERTIRRYMKVLKDNHVIKLINLGKKREWIITV